MTRRSPLCDGAHAAPACASTTCHHAATESLLNARCGCDLAPVYILGCGLPRDSMLCECWTCGATWLRPVAGWTLTDFVDAALAARGVPMPRVSS